MQRGVDGSRFGPRAAWVVVLGMAAAGCGEAAPVVTESPASTVAPVTAASATAVPTATAAPTNEPAPAPAAPPTIPASATAVPAPATTAPPGAAGLAAWLQAIDQSPEATGFAARPPDAYRGAVATGDRGALAPAADEAFSVQELLALIDASGPPPDGADLAAAWADGLVAVAEGLDALAACADDTACQQAFADYEAAYTAWQEAAAALPVAVG